MIAWKRLSGISRLEWDRMVARARDANVIQSYAWGEYRRAFGWEPERWAAFDDGGALVGCLQPLRKRFFRRRVVVWVPGGPVVGFPATQPFSLGEIVATWLEEFRRENALAYARFCSYMPHTAEASYSISRFCVRPFFPINSGFTSMIDVSASIEEFRSGITFRHRRCVKRAEAAGLEWKCGQSEDLRAEMAKLHAEMFERRGIGRLTAGLAALAALDRAFGESYFVLVGYHGGRAVTACLILIAGDRAFYFMGATGAGGRSISAGFGLVVQLVELLKARGIAQLDFGGLAPAAAAAAGIDHFKRGFGGRIVEYIGEWEWAPSKYVRWPMNLLIKHRTRI